MIKRNMAATTEHQNLSSKNGSKQKETMYDPYQKSLLPPSEEKSSKGKCYNFVKIFKVAGDDTSSSNKDQKRDKAAARAPPPVSYGNATLNNKDEGSSSQKRKIPKTYVDPHMVQGFKLYEMSLEIMLLKDGRDDSFKTIGVVGLPSVGKTTLSISL
ncbi:uncharacterized protein LOC111291467 [Durio zibethinus]|uniref:Uncharacterized protein LOC111291467 n=1 Tax=Durio zibethinus TaxID=66656 RepID=A0A6P5YG01_DURZI|nr:uncharacterized protein LOC111291467 [Durio zibethinus]